MTTYVRRLRAVTLGVLVVGLSATLFSAPASAATTSVTASLSPTSGVLSVFGDSFDNVIAVGRDAAGSIFVNDGAVPVSGGTPTVANVTLISMFGLNGNDELRIDVIFGTMPPANVLGGSGIDVVTVTAGAGPDTVAGART